MRFLALYRCMSVRLCIMWLRAGVRDIYVMCRGVHILIACADCDYNKNIKRFRGPYFFMQIRKKTYMLWRMRGCSGEKATTRPDAPFLRTGSNESDRCMGCLFEGIASTRRASVINALGGCTPKLADGWSLKEDTFIDRCEPHEKKTLVANSSCPQTWRQDFGVTWFKVRIYLQGVSGRPVSYHRKICTPQMMYFGWRIAEWYDQV